jgi:16S rRNA processing protein RimM
VPAAPRRPVPVRGTVPLPRLLRITAGARARRRGSWPRCRSCPTATPPRRWRGARVFVSRASFPTPDEGEFYWVDLIGLAVPTATACALGTVTGLIETGPHCVLRVQRAEAEGAERLIPFVDAYVDRVDLPAAASRRLGSEPTERRRCASTSSRCSPSCSRRT